ncbi:Uncharacterised protein [Chryseobacterium nakagawai]|nr:hypothetical protein [Chryseobacterium nakagawai]VEH19212.1 Uncharacterised protein [Chryseobacterium nakagawai]
MKPAQKIFFFLLLWISVFNSKAQISVYKNDSIIGRLHEETERTACEYCYYQEDIVRINKKIKIKIPVTIENGTFQAGRILEITNKGNITILKFNSISDGSSSWIYLAYKRNKTLIIRKLSYNNTVYKKEIKKNDFDYLPATEVCVQNTSEIINEEISFSSSFKFIPGDCYKCPIKTEVDNCIKNGKIKYSW